MSGSDYCWCHVGKPNPETAKDASLQGLVDNNRAWAKAVAEQDPDFFKKLGAGQAPEYLYIGCADARVEPSRMMGLKYAEVFVHRNVGNCASNDFNFLSVLEYAVCVLKVPHILVCGHYECGAVRNASKLQDIGLLENWLRNIRDVRRLHDAELSAIKDPEEYHRRLVELNAIENARNVLKLAPVQRRRHETRDRDAKAAAADGGYAFPTPQVHALVFDPHTGHVKKLTEDIKPLAHVYDLVE